LIPRTTGLHHSPTVTPVSSEFDIHVATKHPFRPSRVCRTAEAWGPASLGAADLDLAVASYAFDVSMLGFANVWLVLGSFAVCAGRAVLSMRVFGRWLGRRPLSLATSSRTLGSVTKVP
jgi:hypothetical protein